MRTSAVHALTTLTLVGAALCAVWLTATEPALLDPLPVAIGR